MPFSENRGRLEFCTAPQTIGFLTTGGFEWLRILLEHCNAWSILTLISRFKFSTKTVIQCPGLVCDLFLDLRCSLLISVVVPDSYSPGEKPEQHQFSSMIPYSRRALRAKHKRLVMLKEGRSQSLDSYEPEEDTRETLSEKQTKAHSWSYMSQYDHHQANAIRESISCRSLPLCLSPSLSLLSFA